MANKLDLKQAESLNHLIYQQMEHILDDSSEISIPVLMKMMKELGEFVDMDRLALFLYDHKKFSFELFTEWCHLGIKPRELKHYIIKDLNHDSYLQQLQEKEIVIENVIDFELKKTWLTYILKDDIKAFYACPLVYDGHFMGYISFENQRRQTSFDEMIKSKLSMLAKLIAAKFQYVMLKNELKNQAKETKASTHLQYGLISNISHEIKTPLNGIHNALYLLQTTDLTKDQKSYLDIAQTASDSISSIVERVLDLEALESKTLEIQTRSFSLEDELIRIVRMYQKDIDLKNLWFNLHFDYNIKHEVIGDDRKLRHILSHIMQNAIKFTSEGGIDLFVEQSSEETYTFKIKDTGIGFPKEKIDQLFKAFYQVSDQDDKEYQGLGIGLTVAHELTLLLGGKMSVESESGQGSIFTIDIPLKKGQMISYKEVEDIKMMIYHDQKPSSLIPLFESMGMKVFDELSIADNKVDVIFFETVLKSGDQLHQLKELHGHNDTQLFALKNLEQRKLKKVDTVIDEPVSRTAMMQKIMISQNDIRKSIISIYTKQLTGNALIVDDNRLNRIALQSILLKLNIQSQLAESGLKAIEMVKSDKYDLILMDIQMPLMDGIETTRRIRSLGSTYQSIPIIAVTANAYFNDYDLLKASQINDVIFKPIKMEALAQILRKYLNHKEVIHIPDELLMFDRGDFLKRFEGSYDIAKEVIETFQAEYVKDLEKIRVAIKQKHPELIIQAVHYYKGSCAYLSGKRVVWILNLMMDYAKQQNLEEMQQLFELVIKESELLISELQAMKMLS